MKGGEEFGVEVVFKQPSDGSVDTQNKTIDDVLLLGVKGLAVSVIKPDAQTRKFKNIAAELPLNNFITIDNDAADSGRLCYVGVDNFEAGKEAGRMVKRALPTGGTVALFIGNTDSTNAKARVAGVLSELAGRDVRAEVNAGKFQDKYGEYVLHRQQPITDDMKQDKAAANAGDTLEQLKATPNVCMVGLYAYNPAKILESARNKGLTGKVKIVGFDEDLVTLDGISKGEIVGSVSQDPFNYGYETVKWLAHIIKGGNKNELPQKATPYSIITQDGATPEIPGIRNRKAAEYAQTISEIYKNAKR
jgi:ribose transport system substrate-binding protein